MGDRHLKFHESRDNLEPGRSRSCLRLANASVWVGIRKSINGTRLLER
jgi:hypothetical protein